MSFFLSIVSQILCIRIPPEATTSVDSLKTTAKSANEEDITECCVCLSRICEGEATRRLPCRHSFHRECVDRWLASCRRTCPLCRVSVDGKATKLADEPLTEDLVIWFSSMLAPGF